MYSNSWKVKVIYKQQQQVLQQQTFYSAHVRLCSFINNVTVCVHVKRERFGCLRGTRDLSVAISAARGTCVCVYVYVCVRNNVYPTSGTREIETNDKNWSCVCVCVCVYVLYGATHATRTRIFQTRLSPNVEHKKVWVCKSAVYASVCDASLFRSGNR